MGNIVSNFRKKSLPNLLKSFSEVVVDVTYKYKTGETYTPGVGNVDTFATVENLNVIRVDYKAEEIDGVVRAGDVKFIIEARSLGQTPTANSLLIIGTETWNIVKVSSKPLDNPVTYFCQCRLQSK